MDNKWQESLKTYLCDTEAQLFNHSGRDAFDTALSILCPQSHS